MDQVRPLLVSQLESFKRVSPQGAEYWMARDLQPLLGYTSWENFANVIEKAKMACESAGVGPEDHFHDVTKGIAAGKGAEIQRVDMFLSRYACYLIGMNGDPRKAEIGLAQTYFAVQTRRQEVRDQHPELRRVEMRQRVKEANRSLNSVAKDAGVQNYGLFHDAGYRGLYGLRLQDIKARKGISPKDDLLDRAGRVELAANEFRITQAEDKLRREKVKGETHAIHTHRQVGEAVRATIQQLGGVVPENLPAEPSIKKLVSAKKPKRLAGGEKARPSPGPRSGEVIATPEAFAE